MGLETGTYINSLVATNPVGAVDPKSQGDNHLRLIKSTLLATFPNLTGAMTADQTELNYLDGATGVTGTGNTVRSASPTLTGTVTAATIAATTLTGAGSGITALNASNLSSGTVPDARFPATLPVASGANLTALNGSNISSGTVADARIDTALARLAGTTAFSANQTISKATAAFTLASTNAASAAIGLSTNGSTRGFIGADGGGTTIGGPGAGASDLGIRVESGSLCITLDGSTTTHLKLSSSGITTPNTSSSEVGYKGIPQVTKSADYTLVLADANKYLLMGANDKTFTIPANSSVAFPIGTTLTFESNTSSGHPTTIAITTDTMFLAGTEYATTGSRSLARGGIATALKRDSTSWIISGTGLS